MTRHLDWAEHPDLVAYYSSHRDRPEDLYPSERRFLPWLAGRTGDVLDVGCGAGGFAAVWRHFNPEIHYAGIDTSAALVASAQERHAELQFIQADCLEGLPLREGTAGVVAALGWLHWEAAWPEALSELWRVTGDALFFDLRLHETGEDAVAEQRLVLTGEWDERTTVPYVVAAWPSVARALLGLEPARILGHGYWGTPADTVMGVTGQVCFATFVLERGPGPTQVALDMPLAWPQELSDVELLASSAVEEALR